jgi:hypothetical protein
MENNDKIELLQAPITKSGQSEMVDAVCQKIMSGELDPIKTEIALKSLEEMIKLIRSNSHVKQITREECEKYGKTFSKFGVEITNSSRTTYDYSGCNDSVYNDLIIQQNDLKEQIKIREQQLKSGADISTGEILNKPASSTTEFLTIKFK